MLLLKALIALGSMATLVSAAPDDEVASKCPLRYDHLTCFKVRESQSKAVLVHLPALQKQYSLKGCKLVINGIKFCVPSHKIVRKKFVTKEIKEEINIELNEEIDINKEIMEGIDTNIEIDNSVAGINPLNDFICYQLHCPRPYNLPKRQKVKDQFGLHFFSIPHKPLVVELCTPARKVR